MDIYIEFPTMLYVFGIQRKEARTKQQLSDVVTFFSAVPRCLVFLRCDWSEGNPELHNF